MLKVTADLFSGRPNPSWIMTGLKAEDLLKKISDNREVIARPNSGYDGLGFRGYTIELLGDEKEGRLPSVFKIANGVARDQKTSIQLVREITDQMLQYERYNMEIHRLTPINREIQKIIMSSIDSYEKILELIRSYIKKRHNTKAPSPIRVTVNDSNCENCQYEESKFNPDFWNADPGVMSSNNCYNYGRNWKTNTFAQPGRASGATSASMSCPDVKAAAMRDGLVERCKCLPASEYPRRLVALVVAPGKDYHWYRKQKGGFWGHKPGNTAARNYDNSGVLITDPQTCDRGIGTYLNYTDFCGFFYAGKSVVIT